MTRIYPKSQLSLSSHTYRHKPTRIRKTFQMSTGSDSGGGGAPNNPIPWNRKVQSLKSIETMKSWGMDVSIKWIELHTSQKPPRFYRIIGQEEKRLLELGETIFGQRYQNNAQLDVTTNPNYNMIPRLGKFLVTFKSTERFDPLAENTHIEDHEIEQDEFYLCHGYSMKDVESIESIGPIN